MNTCLALTSALAAVSLASARIHHHSRWLLSLGPLSIALTWPKRPPSIPPAAQGALAGTEIRHLLTERLGIGARHGELLIRGHSDRRS